MPECGKCGREFASEEVLLQHDSSVHKTAAKHDIKQMRRKEKDEQTRMADSICRAGVLRVLTNKDFTSVAVCADKIRKLRANKFKYLYILI